VTEGHTLWTPTTKDRLFHDPSEKHRRVWARKFLRKALENGRWRKSEYAWEADAWATSFDRMRNDPTLAM
jgi:hypothetical protein